jgi:hypothetical protein
MIEAMMSSVEFWQNLRYAVIYPVLTVTGIGWAIGFYLHYHYTGVTSDRWAGRAGLAVAVFAACGMAGLFVAQQSGFSILTTVVFTFGTLAVVGVMVWGSVWLLHHYLTRKRDT